MKYLLAFFAASFISSFCNGGTDDNSTLDLSNGSWVGSINQTTTVTLPDGNGEENIEIIILNCKNDPEIWMESDDGKYIKIYGSYSIESKSGNSIMTLIAEGDGWVETQNWSFVKTDNTKAYVHWSRMVSNIGLKPDNEYRSFGQLAYGFINKTSEDCNIWDE